MEAGMIPAFFFSAPSMGRNLVVTGAEKQLRVSDYSLLNPENGNILRVLKFLPRATSVRFPFKSFSGHPSN
jgi:hypothetical protein